MNTTVIKPKSDVEIAMADVYLGNVLVNVGSWHVFSTETLEHRDLLMELEDTGAITFRMHYADKFPHGVKAYELTELGLEILEEVVEKTTKDKARAQAAADAANKQREFYRTESSLTGWQKRVSLAKAKAAQDAQAKEALRVIEVQT